MICCKICPKCNKEHYKLGIFCSRSCANSKSKSGPKRKYFPDMTGTTYQRRRAEMPYCAVTIKKCKYCNEFMVLSKEKLYHCPTRRYCHNCSINNVKVYRAECRFNLNPTKFPELFDSEIIKKYGWYSPNSSKIPNIKGVTWDHLYQIQDGFTNKVPPHIINHPANAELVPFEVNYKRKNLSVITYDELLKRIKLWDSGNRNLLRYFTK